MGEGNRVITKRVHIGGLTENTSESEIIEKFSSFGKVKDVEIKIKKDTTGEIYNTFGYISIESDDSSLQKCFSVFNKTKWKGRTLQLQLAKQHFLTRLEKERTTPDVPKVKKVKKSFHNPLEKLPDAVNFDVKGKVPGTAIPGEKKWIVGKYGRILPIVDVRNKSINRIVRVDPSKFCHNLKKIKIEDSWEDLDLNVEKFTWKIDRGVSKRRCGDFSDYEDVFQKRARVSEVKDWSEEMEEKMEEMRRRYCNEKLELVIKDNADMDVEVVKGPKKPSVYHIPKDNFIYDLNDNLSDDISHDDDDALESNSGNSVGSADTDEIIAMMNPSKHNEYLQNMKFNEDIFDIKDMPQTSFLNNKCTSDEIESDLIKSYVDKSMKMSPFKGMSMLDSCDADCNKFSHSTKSVKDDSDRAMDSSLNNEEESKSEQEKSTDTEKVIENMNSTRTENVQDKKDVNLTSLVTCYVNKAMKLTSFKGMSMLDSSDEESTKKSENLLNNEGVALPEVNDIQNNIGKGQNSVKSVNCASSFALLDEKTNLFPISKTTSDSEYDSDDFEKVARKFEANVRSTLSKTEAKPSKPQNNTDPSSKTSSSVKSVIQDESSSDNYSGYHSSSSSSSSSSDEKKFKEESSDGQDSKGVPGEIQITRYDPLNDDHAQYEIKATNTKEDDIMDFENMSGNNDEKESIDGKNDSEDHSSSDNDSSDNQSSDDSEDDQNEDNTGQENKKEKEGKKDDSSNGNSDDDDSDEEDDNSSDEEGDDSSDEEDDDSSDEENDDSSEDDDDSYDDDKDGDTVDEKAERSVKSKKKNVEEELLEDIKEDKFFISSSLLTTFSKKSNESSGGFSFLKSFGSKNVDESNEDVSNLPWQLKPKTSDKEVNTMEKGKKSGKRSEGDTTFFFQPNDARLKEGTEFFHRIDPPDIIERNWLEDKSIMLTNFRQRHRAALRKINLEKLKQRQKPQNFAFRGKRTIYH